MDFTKSARCVDTMRMVGLLALLLVIPTLAQAVSVTLGWTPGPYGQSAYEVWRSDNGAGYVKIATLQDPTGTLATYVDTSVPSWPGRYCYYLTSINAGSSPSVPSTTVCIPTKSIQPAATGFSVFR